MSDSLMSTCRHLKIELKIVKQNDGGIGELNTVFITVGHYLESKTSVTKLIQCSEANIFIVD